MAHILVNKWGGGGGGGLVVGGGGGWVVGGGGGGGWVGREVLGNKPAEALIILTRRCRSEEMPEEGKMKTRCKKRVILSSLELSDGVQTRSKYSQPSKGMGESHPTDDAGGRKKKNPEERK